MTQLNTSDYASNKKRILVVDGRPELMHMLKLTLETTGKFEVKTEDHAANAVNAARTFAPDMLLLGATTLETKGKEIAAQIKDNEDLEAIKIIFLKSLTAEKTGMPRKLLTGKSDFPVGESVAIH